jgi:Putative addiction module component
MSGEGNMPDLVDVLKSALSLNADDRAAVAEKLLASLDELDKGEANRLWAEEAARRQEEFRAGRARAVEASDVAKQAERLFR